MQLPDEVVDDVRKRLRRAAGQVQAVERMLAEGKECRDVVTQLSAATKALEQAGFRLIAVRADLLPRQPRRRGRRRLSPRSGRADVHEAGMTMAEIVALPILRQEEPCSGRGCGLAGVRGVQSVPALARRRHRRQH